MATTDKTPLTQAQLQNLLSPLHGSRVARRSQQGKSLSYVEAYDIKAMLIRIFGFGGFDFITTESTIIDMREVPKSSGTGTNWKVTAKVQGRLTIHQTGAVYEEGAASTNTSGDLGEAMDNAIKSAASDALKRCAIFLGTQFGLSLYNNGSMNDVVQAVFDPLQHQSLMELRKQAQQQPVQLPPQQAQQRIPAAGTTPEQVAAGQAMIQHAMGGQP